MILWSKQNRTKRIYRHPLLILFLRIYVLKSSLEAAIRDMTFALENFGFAGEAWGSIRLQIILKIREIT
jgi:hypothetical protein